MKRSLIALAALSAVTICTSAALAENRAGSFNLTPVIGGYHWDGTQGVDANLLYGLNAGYNFTDRLGMEALLHYVHTKEYSGGYGNTMDAVNYRLEGLYHLTPQNKLVPYLALGIGGLRSYFNSSNYDDSVLASYGGGVKYALTDNVALRADARMMSVFYNPSVVYNYEYTLGLNFQLGGKSKAAKAAEPVPAPKPVEPPPAPKPVEPPPAPKPAPAPAPVAAVPKQAPVEAPAPAPTAQLTANPASVEKSNSTTLSWSAQNSSECSIMPGIGPVQQSGSMVVSPASSTTYKLACKGKGGAAESSATVDVVQPAPVIEKTPECKSMTLSVTFDTGKAVIKQKYHDELKQVAEKLKAFPKASTVIEGHTDNVGSASLNKKLSQHRADAVRKYLIDEQGIDGSRISAKGFGNTKPVDSNKTKTGRSKNRRVEAVFTCPE
jgi:OOP family OmpA-OmpF porin